MCDNMRSVADWSVSCRRNAKVTNQAERLQADLTTSIPRNDLDTVVESPQSDNLRKCQVNCRCVVLVLRRN